MSLTLFISVQTPSWLQLRAFSFSMIDSPIFYFSFESLKVAKKKKIFNKQILLRQSELERTYPCETRFSAAPLNNTLLLNRVISPFQSRATVRYLQNADPSPPPFFRRASGVR